MDIIDPEPDPWTTSQLNISPVLSLWSCLLTTGHYLTLVTVIRPVPDLWINFLACPQPGFITMDLPVPHPHRPVWRSGQTPGAGPGPAQLPLLCPVGKRSYWLSPALPALLPHLAPPPARSSQPAPLADSNLGSSYLWHGLQPGQLGKLR